MENMTKWEALKQIEKLKEYIEQEEKEILVPEDIKIEKHCWHWDSLWIMFNDNKQVLLYRDYEWWVYYVDGSRMDDTIQCKLVPCKREDFKSWDTAFRSDWEEPILSKLFLYCKILNNWKCVYIDRNIEIKIDSDKYNNWRKVVQTK